MKGSVKQIAWAEKIQKQAIKVVASVIASTNRSNMPNEQKQVNNVICQAIIDVLENMDEAKWFIEHEVNGDFKDFNRMYNVKEFVEAAKACAEKNAKAKSKMADKAEAVEFVVNHANEINAKVKNIEDAEKIYIKNYVYQAQFFATRNKDISYAAVAKAKFDRQKEEIAKRLGL